MCIPQELIKPNSPEHIDYFLGWFYQYNLDFKEKIWDMVLSKKEKIEFNEYYFLIDSEKEMITVYSIYDEGTHNCFFARDDWKLDLSFEDFKKISGIYTIDFDKYYELISDCQFAIDLINEEIEENPYFDKIKENLEKMISAMDLNIFIPDFQNLIKHIKNEDISELINNIILNYMIYAKPIDVISKSNLCR